MKKYDPIARRIKYLKHRKRALERGREYRKENSEKLNRIGKERYLKRKQWYKDWIKKYRQTEKGRIITIKSVRKYQQTTAGKETIRRTALKYPLKTKARNIVNGRIKSGKLIRKPCEVCGNPKTHAHHTDYNKPLKVKWLCMLHHRHQHGHMLWKK